MSLMSWRLAWGVVGPGGKERLIARKLTTPFRHHSRPEVKLRQGSCQKDVSNYFRFCGSSLHYPTFDFSSHDLRSPIYESGFSVTVRSEPGSDLDMEFWEIR